MGLFLSDIPLHDIARDFTLLAEQRMARRSSPRRLPSHVGPRYILPPPAPHARALSPSPPLTHAQAEANLKERFERLNQQLKHTTKELVEERARSDRLLHQMLPREVANQLRHGNTVDAKPYPEVTILFSDIVNFSVIARKSTPHEVCVMLNELCARPPGERAGPTACLPARFARGCYEPLCPCGWRAVRGGSGSVDS